MENEKQYKVLMDWIKRLIPEDWDKYDLEANFDSTLDISENKSKIRKDISIFMKENLKEQAEQVKSQLEEVKAREIKLANEQKEQAEQEVIEWNKNREFDENVKIDIFYKSIYRMVDKIVMGYSNLAFIKGNAGIGKSQQIEKRLHKHNKGYVSITGEVTEAYLYRLIYENNGKIIYFKDVVQLLTGLKSINLLKSACESTGKRILTKSSYSKQQDDLPDKFVCRCSFIFDYNTITGLSLKEDFEALKNRGDFKQLVISDVEMKAIMREIAKTDIEKEVTEFLIKNFNENGRVKINLRTQYKSFQTYKFAKKMKLDWKTEIIEEMSDDISEVRGLLYSLIGNKAIKTKELKQMLLRKGIATGIRNADRKINQWLFTNELYKWDNSERNFYVGINEKEKGVN